MFRVSRGLAAGMISLIFPYFILHELHWSPLKLGLIYTAAALGTAGLGLLVGFMADVWGRKRTLFVVGILLPVSVLLIALFHQTWVVFLAAILGGFSATGSLAGGGVGGAGQPIQSALIGDLSPPNHRTSYFATFAFIGGSSAAVGMVTMRFLSIQDGLYLAFALSLLGVLPILFMKVKLKRGSIKRLQSKVVISKFSLTGILNGASQGLVTPFMIPFFVLVYHLPKNQMASVGFVSGLLGAAALLLAPVLESRMGFVKSIAVTRGLGALLLVSFPFILYLPYSYFVYLITPALRVIAVPVQQAAIADMVQGDEYGRSLGLNQVSRLLASAGGTALTGALFNASIIALPFVIYGALMAANIGLYIRFFPDRDKTAK